MGELTVTRDPEELGFDADRLRRIDSHFARYVDDGRLPGWLALVSRRGEIAHLATYGARDVASGAPVESDTLFRIYSMSKPVTSVAAMLLYEEGELELTDPVSRFIPAFADMRVYQNGMAANPITRPATEPIRIWHLLTHTSGLTYGFHRVHVVDQIYRRAGFDRGLPPISTSPRPPTGSPISPCSSNRGRSGTTPSPPTYSGGWSRRCRASRWSGSWPSGSSTRCA